MMRFSHSLLRTIKRSPAATVPATASRVASHRVEPSDVLSSISLRAATYVPLILSAQDTAMTNDQVHMWAATMTGVVAGGVGSLFVAGAFHIYKTHTLTQQLEDQVKAFKKEREEAIVKAEKEATSVATITATAIATAAKEEATKVATAAKEEATKVANQAMISALRVAHDANKSALEAKRDVANILENAKLVAASAASDKTMEVLKTANVYVVNERAPRGK